MVREGARSFEWVLPHDARSPRVARNLLDHRCQELDFPGEMRELVRLVATELVTNAFLHTGSALNLRFDIEPDHVRLEVSDDEPLFRRPSLDRFATNGRGLHIIESLSSNWGVRSSPGGKTVWATISRKWPVGPGTGGSQAR